VLDEDRPWLGEEPSGRPDPTFHPGTTGIGVFFAVAGPIVFAGVARAEGTNWLIVVIGLAAGVLVGALVASWLESRGGRGPRQPL
jgi:hypothetical protein